MLHRIAVRFREIWAIPAVRTAIPIFLAVRLILALWLPFVRQVLYSAPLPPDPIWRPYMGVAIEPNPWLEAWQRWDTLHYQAIAERGYAAFDTALFAPPLYPWLMQISANLAGGNTLFGGMIVSNLAYIAALIALYRLVQHETDDPEIARRTLIYLAFFPSAFFFLAAYTESLFLLAVVLCLAAARRKRWVAAGLLGGAAALTRIPGLVLIVPLGFAALQEWRRSRNGRGFSSVALTVVGYALFPLYIWINQGGTPGMILSASLARGSRFALPGANVIRSLGALFAGNLGASDVFDLCFTLGFIALTVPVWRLLPRLYGVYYISMLALYLARMGTIHPLYAMTRYVLVLFPAFILLGSWGRNPWINRAVLYLSWPLLFFMSGVFALWGWIG
jgi:hypothetical protein